MCRLPFPFSRLFLVAGLMVGVALAAPLEDLEPAETNVPTVRAEVVEPKPPVEPAPEPPLEPSVIEGTNGVPSPIATTPAAPPQEPKEDPALARLVPAVDALAVRLSRLESALASQHQQSFEAGQETTRAILLVAGCFATAAVLGALMAAVILSRALRRVSDVVLAALPPARQLVGGASPVALGVGELATGVPAGAVDRATARFLEAIEQLEKRIGELEHSVRDAAALPGGSAGARPAGANGGSGAAGFEFSVSTLQQKQYPEEVVAGVVGTDPGVPWLGKGQALLNLGQAEEALACFDRAVELSPKHPDAHVKRGMALEKLGKLEAALASYDQAISVDGSLTLAYLYKGAVCNRLQRFREALECYESALRCEQKQVA